jgi:MarR family 2-MHQ and catechol resistance regulon transcriptional repressor
MTRQQQEETTSGAHLWLVMWKAARAMQRFDEQSIQALNLCFSDFVVLELLLHKGALPVNVIGRKVSLTSGSITTAVDRLQKKGLVRRKQDEQDRRVTRVELTSKGQTLISNAYAEHSSRLELPVEELTGTEREQLANLLKKVGKKAEELTQ